MKGVPTPGMPADPELRPEECPAGRRQWRCVTPTQRKGHDEGAEGRARKSQQGPRRADRQEQRTERLLHGRQARRSTRRCTTPRSKPSTKPRCSTTNRSPSGPVWPTLTSAPLAQKTGAEASALYDKGFDAFRKAIELKPDDPAYYNNFALALAKDKKIDEAKANLDKATQLDPPGRRKVLLQHGRVCS